MRRFLSTLAASLPAVLLALSALCAGADPRPPDALDAGELRGALRKLQATGSLLYIGAHPDDDNTSLLACLARGRRVRAAYLSLTRGDGGQNILGPESGAALGVLRTQELLASRRVDGAEQFFTRALDYGFSKSADEALELWGHERALADVVWVIRSFRPDVVVTRFGTDGSGGHGHHTASAILAGEAFRAAADSTRFPEQLRDVTTWQAKRLLWNTWTPNPDPNAPKPVTVDVGAYDPELGLSYSELGGRARSLNRSQGAGTRERRGSILETFRTVDGEPAVSDLFDGVTLDWSRVAGGAAVAAALAAAEARLDPDRPWTILPELARARRALAALPDDPLTRAKRRDLESLMRSCAGLWLEALADAPTASPGDTVRVTLTAVGRAPTPLTLERIELPFGARAWHALPAPPVLPPGPGAAAATPRVDPTAPADSVPRALEPQRPAVALASVVLPADLPPTQPFWLRERPTRGSFEIADPRRVGEAEDAPALVARVTVDFGDEPVTFEVPVAFKWTDRVQGDRYRALEVLPPVTCRLDQDAYLFADTRPHEVRLAVQSTRAARLGRGAPAAARGLERRARRGARDARARRRAGRALQGHRGPRPAGGHARGRGRGEGPALREQPHPHRLPARPAPDAALPLRGAPRPHGPPEAGARLAYLMGPGDPCPDALRQMGYEVDAARRRRRRERRPLALRRHRRRRARLQHPAPAARAPAAAARVREERRHGWSCSTTPEPTTRSNDRLGPWPLRISPRPGHRRGGRDALPRAREPAAARAQRDHGRATSTAGCRSAGSTSPSTWDARYEPCFARTTPASRRCDGGLLVARYGKGAFVYTGLAFFRQLPAGVPGAYRLFANLLGHDAPRGEPTPAPPPLLGSWRNVYALAWRARRVGRRSSTRSPVGVRERARLDRPRRHARAHRLCGAGRPRRTATWRATCAAATAARWPTIGSRVMATQASAITFLSTPGQAYEDGMRFVQFYFGLPLAMVVLSRDLRARSTTA